MMNSDLRNARIMTQELYQKAMKFAGEKHSQQKVPGTNANYLLHISNVAMEVLLAELVEHFAEGIATAVQALTKDPGLASKEERMNNSLEKIKALGDEVGIVKLADRITNLQSPPEHWDSNKRAKYLEKAQLIYECLSSKNKYLATRFDFKIQEYKDNL